MPDLELATPPGSPAEFHIRIEPGPPTVLSIREPGGAAHSYQLADLDASAFLAVHEGLARAFRLRPPHARHAAPAAGPSLEPILTEPVSPRILYGYGDPCVVRIGEADYRLLVTSNDAPDAFPILASADLANWRLQGFVFPQGSTPAWALTGPQVSDFWAPELHRLGDSWIICFTARRHDRSLAIGLARSASPDGPFNPDPEPLVTGGVIDSHILVDAEGHAWLVWKKDDNDVWPRRLAELLHRRPTLVAALFTSDAEQRTAALALTLWPWLAEAEPMVQFFALQPLIEAAAEDLAGFEQRLDAVRGGLDAGERRLVDEIRAALRTRIYAQRLSPDARRLTGDPAVILENDQAWEGHLIEGVWITQHAGRYVLFYAGNDFSTARYGVGAAVADAPLGPYRKADEVFLRSTDAWWGPGHPSVAVGPDGRPRIFLHAFRPGEAGYKAFRALLSAPLSFAGGRVAIDS